MEAQAGVADGGFAGRAGRPRRPDRAARADRRRSWPGWTSRALGRPELADLLRRLGVRTLGDFAALPAGDVLARFGFDAALAHRLAAGADDRPLAVRRPPPDLAVTGEYDRRSSGSTWPRSPPGPWPSGCTSGWPGTGWPAPGWASRRSPPTGEELHRTWRHDGLLDRRGDRRPGALAARRLAGHGAGASGAHRRHPPAAAGPGRGGRRARACSPGCGGSRGGRRAGAPGRWPGCRACSGRTRCSPRCSAAGAARPTRCGWCRGATSGPGDAATAPRGPGGCPPPAPGHRAARAGRRRPSTTRAGRPVTVGRPA